MKRIQIGPMTLSNARSPIKVELYGDWNYKDKIGETTMQIPRGGTKKREAQTYYFMNGGDHAKCARGWVGPALKFFNDLYLSGQDGRDTCNCLLTDEGRAGGCNVHMVASLSWEKPVR